MPTLPSVHGALRGSEDPRSSRNFEGRFGRMFRNLSPARFKEDDLLELGKRMISKAKKIDETEADLDENRKIPAGYTYLGQFVDHDLTFDPASSLQRDNDPQALVNYRTPRFDLDCVYGRGPQDQPYLYRRDGVRMLLGAPLENGSWDVPRSSPPEGVDEPARAIIGDPRNDENVIITQLHALFLRFHNRMAEEQKMAGSNKADFETVQQLVRWHYQWVVLDDFLRKVVNEQTYDDVLPHVRRKSNPYEHPPKLRFYKPKDNAYIPIEFSAAAYRFGHSMVRPQYRLNSDDRPAVGGPFPILSGNPGSDALTGFNAFQTTWGIEWHLFFEGISPTAQKPRTRDRVQYSYKIDTQLAEPLGDLPFAFTRDQRSLALRNLIRGSRLGLPSGQAVADAMAVQQKLRPEIDPPFETEAPLWYYVLAEAEQKFAGETLGPVGGRIVMETFVGLMMEDGHSLLRQNPLWKLGEHYGMAEFVRFATGQPATAK